MASAQIGFSIGELKGTFCGEADKLQSSVNFFGEMTLVFEGFSSSAVPESSVLSVRTR